MSDVPIGRSVGANQSIGQPIDVQEMVWWQQWREQRDIQARDHLAVLHLPYARTVAASYYARRRHDEIEFADYLQLANLGMMEAMERYDPGRGVLFRTFAARRMHGSILNGLDTMTEKQQQIAVRKRVQRDRLASLADVPRSSMDAPVSLHGERLFAYLADVGIGLALSFLLEGTGMIEAGESVEYSPTAETYYRRTELRQLRQRLLEHVDRLKPQARRVIHGHYVQELAFDDIAHMMGLTKGRISQIHREALLALRTLLREATPCDAQF